MRSLTCLLLGLSLLVLAAPADANRRTFTRAWEADTGTAGETELELWLDLRTDKIDNLTDMHWFWWLGPRFSPVDHLEFAQYLLLGFGEKNRPNWLITQMRYRPYPVGALPVDVFLQIEFIARIEGGARPGISQRLGISKAIHSLRFAGNLAFTEWFNRDQMGYELEWNVAAAWVRGGGANLRTSPVSLGLEAFGQVALQGRLPLSQNDQPLVFLGPSVSTGFGRLWLTTSVTVGLHDSASGPRLLALEILGFAM